MSEKKNILTQPKGYNVSRMIFSNPVIGTIGDVTYRRIWISTKHPDGSTGSLLLPTEQLYSFGISENRNPATKQITGYSMALAMWSKENPTQEQKDLTNTLTKINEHCVKHLVSIRKEIKQPKLVKEALPKFGGLYWKEDEDGNIIKGAGPTLYPKIVLEYDGRKKKKQDDDQPQELKDATLDRVRTMFYDYETGQSIDPKTLLGRACAVEAVIKIESIFVGAKTALQIKLYEARVKLFDSGMRRLLTQRPPAESQVEESEEINPIAKKDDEDDEGGGDDEEVNEDDEEEEEAEIPISDNDEEDEAPPPKPALKVKAVKKVPPRKTKK